MADIPAIFNPANKLRQLQGAVAGLGVVAQNQQDRQYGIDAARQYNHARVQMLSAQNAFFNDLAQDPDYDLYDEKFTDAQAGIYNSIVVGITNKEAARQFESDWQLNQVNAQQNVDTLKLRRTRAVGVQTLIADLDLIATTPPLAGSNELQRRESLDNRLHDIQSAISLAASVGTIDGATAVAMQERYRDKAEYEYLQRESLGRLEAKVPIGEIESWIDSQDDINVDSAERERLKSNLRGEDRATQIRETAALVERREELNSLIVADMSSGDMDLYREYEKDNYFKINSSILASGGGYGTKEWWINQVRARIDAADTANAAGMTKDADRAAWIVNYFTQFDNMTSNYAERQTERMKFLQTPGWGIYQDEINANYEWEDHIFTSKQWLKAETFLRTGLENEKDFKNNPELIGLEMWDMKSFVQGSGIEDATLLFDLAKNRLADIRGNRSIGPLTSFSQTGLFRLDNNQLDDTDMLIAGIAEGKYIGLSGRGYEHFDDKYDRLLQLERREYESYGEEFREGGARSINNSYIATDTFGRRNLPIITDQTGRQYTFLIEDYAIDDGDIKTIKGKADPVLHMWNGLGWEPLQQLAPGGEILWKIGHEPGPSKAEKEARADDLLSFTEAPDLDPNWTYEEALENAPIQKGDDLWDVLVFLGFVPRAASDALIRDRDRLMDADSSLSVEDATAAAQDAYEVGAWGKDGQAGAVAIYTTKARFLRNMYEASAIPADPVADWQAEYMGLRNTWASLGKNQAEIMNLAFDSMVNANEDLEEIWDYVITNSEWGMTLAQMQELLGLREYPEPEPSEESGEALDTVDVIDASEESASGQAVQDYIPITGGSEGGGVSLVSASELQFDQEANTFKNFTSLIASHPWMEDFGFGPETEVLGKQEMSAYNIYQNIVKNIDGSIDAEGREAVEDFSSALATNMFVVNELLSSTGRDALTKSESHSILFQLEKRLGEQYPGVMKYLATTDPQSVR